MSYDSTADTLLHIKRVNELLSMFAVLLLDRGVMHDNSKLQSPEKEAFDAETPNLKGLTYGSPEYEESLKRLAPALAHHYENNRHHPEHYANGVDDMDLLDVMEMLVDWKAATERHADGDIHKSLETNRHRFHITGQLTRILRNTIIRYL